MKRKAICLVRVSTERQVDEEQGINLVKTAQNEGYKEIEVIEEKESGFKNEEERKGLNRLKESIELGGVSCVYARHIDRIARKRKVLYSVLEYLTARKIQLRIIDPDLKYLNDDGTINEYADMAFALFAQMAESEMRVKKTRFKEGKDNLRKQNLFTGHNVQYGYKVVDKMFVVDEEKAFFVRKAFELYNKGYSQRRTYQELVSLGFDGSSYLCQYGIHCEAYIGGYSFKGIKYPAIISQEVFDEAQRISQTRRSAILTKSRDVLCRKLIVCKDCGQHYTVQGTLYCCENGIGKQRNFNKVCNNKCSISIITLDKFIWELCTQIGTDMARFDHQKQKKSNSSEIDTLKRKIRKLQNDIESTTEKIDVLTTNYIDGIYTKKQYDKNLQRISSQKSEKNNELSKLQARLDSIENDFEQNVSSQQYAKLKRMEYESMIENDFQNACNFVHSIIEKIELDKTSFEDKTVTIFFKEGTILKYKYRPKKRIWNEKFEPIMSDTEKDFLDKYKQK